MGRVYRARDQSLDRDVAIKVLHQHLGGEDRVARRFHREARAASRLSHPNSIQILDFGAAEGGVLYIAMELLDGEDLQVILDHDFPLTPRRISDILGQALLALDEAHHVGIIHRDFKPENILVFADRSGRDRVKVCDFGIAKILDGEGQTITVDGFVCGTPQYMAPEQARGEDVDRRVDVYAAGVVLYQMLTGVPPFAGDTALGIITKHLTDEPVPPRKRRPELGIPESFEAIALKAMHKDRAQRYATARQMAEALAEAAQALGPMADDRLGEGALAEEARRSEEVARQATLEAATRTAAEATVRVPATSAAGGGRIFGGSRWIAGLVGLAGIGLLVLLGSDLLGSGRAPSGHAVGETEQTRSARAEGARPFASGASRDEGGERAEASGSGSSPIPESTSRAPVASAETASSDPALEAEDTAFRPVGSRPRGASHSGGTARSAVAQEVASSRAPASTFEPQLVPSPTAGPVEDVTSPSRRAYDAGRRAFLAQDFRAAIDAFEEAARLSPADPEVHKQLGRACMRAGDVARGVAAYRRYLELAPNARDRAVVESIIGAHAPASQPDPGSGP